MVGQWFGWCSLKGGLKTTLSSLLKGRTKTKEAKRNQEVLQEQTRTNPGEKKGSPDLCSPYCKEGGRRTVRNKSSDLFRSHFPARSNSSSKKDSQKRPPFFLACFYEKGSENKPVATVRAVARRRRRCRGGGGGSLSLTGEVEWVLGRVAGGDGRRGRD